MGNHNLEPPQQLMRIMEDCYIQMLLLQSQIVHLKQVFQEAQLVESTWQPTGKPC